MQGFPLMQQPSQPFNAPPPPPQLIHNYAIIHYFLFHTKKQQLINYVIRNCKHCMEWLKLTETLYTYCILYYLYAYTLYSTVYVQYIEFIHCPKKALAGSVTVKNDQTWKIIPSQYLHSTSLYIQQGGSIFSIGMAPAVW